MYIFGIGLHLVLAGWCAVHVVRTGQFKGWLFVLFALPGLGALLYLLTMRRRRARLQRLAEMPVKAQNPERELREAANAYADAPTAQHHMRLAAAQLDAGQIAAAAASYEACLAGPFANDLALRWGAARVALATGKPRQALAHLDFIASKSRKFHPQDTQLLRARTLAALGDQAGARAQFEATVARFDGFEPTAEFAIWAAQQRDRALHAQLVQQLREIRHRWDRGEGELHADVLRRLHEAEQAMTADSST